jgi:hypothetical protein
MLQNACTTFDGKTLASRGAHKQCRLLYRTPCNLVGIYHLFEGICLLHLQEMNWTGRLYTSGNTVFCGWRRAPWRTQRNFAIPAAAIKKNLAGHIDWNCRTAPACYTVSSAYLPQCLAFSLHNFHYTVSGKTVKHSYHFVPSVITLSNVFCNQI